MSDRSLRIALGALGLAGAAIAAYLLSARLRGAELVCAAGGCGTVQDSPYAEVAGVPVSALGLAGFLLLAATALTVRPGVLAAAASLALAALAFSTYLLVVQVAVIGAVCEWCAASDAILTGATAVVLLRLRGALGAVSSPAGPARARSGRAPRGSSSEASA